MAGTGAGQPAERQAARQPEAFAQPGRALVLRDYRSVGRSVEKALGGLYRRLKGRRGGLVANLALARKLAELFWRLMVHGRAYVEKGIKQYEAKVAQTEQRLLQKLARKYNLVLQPKVA